jgi:pimeloyl-ACP methyl ester carboxylesterase
MPGWGGSSPYRGRSYFDAGRDAWLVLEHIGVPQDAPVHIVGTSFGAGNAAAMASIAFVQINLL